VGEIATASGVPLTTLRRWMGNRLPDLPEHKGIKAIPAAEFEQFVRVCKAARAAALTTTREREPEPTASNIGEVARHGVCIADDAPIQVTARTP
jgi:hypothetical protein